MATILLVEDDSEISESVMGWLEMEKYSVDRVSSGEEAVLNLENNSYDLILLDWGLPRMKGSEVFKRLRALGGHAPVIFLTGRYDLDLRSFGFDGGPDDFITKPFDMRELSHRIRAHLKRPGNQPAKIALGNVLLDPDQRKLFVDSKPVRLTNKEYAVLELLLRHPNQVFSSRAVMEAIWADDSDSSEDLVHACLRNLRRKMAADGQSCLIRAIDNTGYTVRAVS